MPLMFSNNNMMIGAAGAGADPDGNATQYNGAGDHVGRNSLALTGATDNNAITINGMFRRNGTANAKIIFKGGNNHVLLQIDVDQKLRLVLKDAAGDVKIDWISTYIIPLDYEFNLHIAAKTESAGTLTCYFNGLLQTGSFSADISATICWEESALGWWFGGDDVGGSDAPITLSQMWVDNSFSTDYTNWWSKVTEHPVALNQLGMLLRRQGKFLEAESAYLKAVTASPGYALAHYNLGVLNDLYLQRLDAALRHYERYQALAGEDHQVTKWIVDLKRRIGVAQRTANVTG